MMIVLWDSEIWKFFLWRMVYLTPNTEGKHHMVATEWMFVDPALEIFKNMN